MNRRFRKMRRRKFARRRTGLVKTRRDLRIGFRL